MSDSDHLLSFEWNGEDDVLEIHGDQEGFRRFSDLVCKLADRSNPEHCDLMTPEWGGEILTSDPQNTKEIHLVNHVKLVYWPKTAE